MIESGIIKESELKKKIDMNVLEIEKLKRENQSLRDENKENDTKSREIIGKPKLKKTTSSQTLNFIDIEKKSMEEKLEEMKVENERLRSLNKTLMNNIEQCEKVIGERGGVKVMDVKLKAEIFSLTKERDSWKDKTREIVGKLVKEKERNVRISTRLGSENECEKKHVAKLMKKHDALKAVILTKENAIEEMKNRVDEMNATNEQNIDSFRLKHEELLKEMAKRNEVKFEIENGGNIEICERSELNLDMKDAESSFEIEEGESFQIYELMKKPHRKYPFVRDHHYDTSDHKFDESGLKKAKKKKRKKSFLSKFKRMDTSINGLNMTKKKLSFY